MAQQPSNVRKEPEPPFPQGKQGKPGFEEDLDPKPRWQAEDYKAAGKLEGKVALITGGDSGIGRAVAALYAREGADVAFTYLDAEAQDAKVTTEAVEKAGRRCLAMAGDLGDAAFCGEVVERTVNELGRIDILVNNAAHQNRKQSVEDVTDEEWDRTFNVNIGAYFRLVRAAVPHMEPGSAIIATSSETGLMGSAQLPDYSATKGAINAFTKTLAQKLLKKGIRVNAVAPGPVWTPLNPADKGMAEEKVEEFGKQAKMNRPAQPEEIAPAYVFFASNADSSFITGVVLPQLGGQTTSG